MLCFRKGISVLLASVPVILWSSLSPAADMALSVTAGTLGPGLELTVGVNEHLNVRVGPHWLPYSYTGEEDDIEYEFDLTLFSASALLDWHPFGGGFRLSGGAVLNNNELEGKAMPLEPVEIGDTEYQPGQVDTLTALVDFAGLSPYAGLGYGNAVGEGKRWGFTCDLGVLFQGAPDVSLSATGVITQNSSFRSDLAREEENLQEDLEEFKYYPVVALGVSYKF